MDFLLNGLSIESKNIQNGVRRRRYDLPKLEVTHSQTQLRWPEAELTCPGLGALAEVHWPSWSLAKLHWPSYTIQGKMAIT